MAVRSRLSHRNKFGCGHVENFHSGRGSDLADQCVAGTGMERIVIDLHDWG